MLNGPLRPKERMHARGPESRATCEPADDGKCCEVRVVVNLVFCECIRFPETVRGIMRHALLALAALLASSTALRLEHLSKPPQPTRRSFLLAAPALLALPPQVRAAATGGGFQDSQFTSIGGGPPKLVNVPALTKGEPSPQEHCFLSHQARRPSRSLVHYRL